MSSTTSAWCYTCSACITCEATISISVSVRLSDSTAKALQDLSRQTDRPMTYFIEKALQSYLAEYADYQVTLDRLRNRDDRVIPASELRTRLARKR